MIEKEKRAEVQGTKALSHQAKIRPDKSLLSEEIRKMFLTYLEIKGHQHEFKEIIYFPREIFREKIFDKFCFFVPAVRTGILENKLSIPIFMIEFTPEQKGELIACAQKNRLRLFSAYFSKPKISIDYGEREEICPNLEDNQEENSFQGETPLDNEVHHQEKHQTRKISLPTDVAVSMGYPM